MQQPKLKDCPFCGSMAIFVCENECEDRDNYYFIKCSKCWCKTFKTPEHYFLNKVKSMHVSGYFFDHSKSMQELAEIWNKRS